jgi:hypothetical protein
MSLFKHLLRKQRRQLPQPLLLKHLCTKNITTIKLKKLVVSLKILMTKIQIQLPCMMMVMFIQMMLVQLNGSLPEALLLSIKRQLDITHTH